MHIGRPRIVDDLVRVTARVRRTLAPRIASRTGGRGAILLYHRVGDPGSDIWSLGVDPRRFAAQVEMLATEFRPISLLELAAAANRRRIPEGAVAVTFDDGYVDNLHRALPILERFEVPATVFVATGFIGAGRPFWWDEVHRLLDVAPPTEIALRVGARTHRIEAGSDPRDAERLAAEALRRASPSEIDDAVAAIAMAAPDDGGGRVAEGRPLTRPELVTLASSALIEIGAHTRIHPGLDALDEATLRSEVEGGRDDLDEWLGECPRSFSYPFGRHGPAVRRAVRRAGFELAATAYPQPVTWLGNDFELGRIWADDVAPEELGRRIAAVIG